APENNVEVHAVDANTRVIFNAQINVFLDTKPKIASVGEPQIHMSYLQALLQDFFSFSTSDCAMACNLLITSDSKGSDSSFTFGEYWSLASELLQHFGCPGQSVTRFTHTNVQAELADAQLAHDVLFGLVLVSLQDEIKEKS
ncbi:hypothetical protein EGW08_016071, partial [Elysia chlorotica]